MLDDLTIREVREVAKVAALLSPKETRTTPIGKYCIIRTYSAGVHIGTLAQWEGKCVTLTGTRRIWHWTGAFTLSEIAVDGITGDKLSEEIPEIILTEAIEIIPMSQKAEECLRNIKTHKP